MTPTFVTPQSIERQSIRYAAHIFYNAMWNSCIALISSDDGQRFAAAGSVNLWFKFGSGARSDRNQMRQVLRIWPPAALPLTPQP
jgi:hypothetical protein